MTPKYEEKQMKIILKDALGYFNSSVISLDWTHVNNLKRVLKNSKQRFLFETDLEIEIKFRLLLSIIFSLR